MNFYHPYMMSLSGGMGSPQNIQQQNQHFINQNSNTGSYQIPANNGILMQQLGMASTPPPILTGVGTPPPVGTPPARRDAVSMAVPRQSVGLAEKLMRVGGAIVGGSEQGGLTAFNAGAAEYGNIMDQQRKLDASANDLMGARIAKSALAQEEAQAANAEALAQFGSSLNDFGRARGFLQAGGITGLFDGTLGKGIDSVTGAPAAGGRLLLEKLKVDDALMRIAQTKGAISNKEMDLFLAPAPSNLQDEKVWLDWISEREKAISTIMYRLQNNQVVSQKNQATAQSVQQYQQQLGVGTIGTPPTQAGQTQTYQVGGQAVPIKKIQ
jgi:hypothetical protein